MSDTETTDTADTESTTAAWDGAIKLVRELSLLTTVHGICPPSWLKCSVVAVELALASNCPAISIVRDTTAEKSDSVTVKVQQENQYSHGVGKNSATRLRRLLGPMAVKALFLNRKLPSSVHDQPSQYQTSITANTSTFRSHILRWQSLLALAAGPTSLYTEGRNFVANPTGTRSKVDEEVENNRRFRERMAHVGTISQSFVDTPRRPEPGSVRLWHWTNLSDYNNHSNDVSALLFLFDSSLVTGTCATK